MFHHTNDLVCPLCEDKLKSADPRLVAWYRAVKIVYPDLHISCSYRGKEDQELAFEEGKSRAHYPHSKHNHTDETGTPCSLAIDVFALLDHAAHYDRQYFKNISEHPISKAAGIVWGGTFRSISDLDHFEVSAVLFNL